jgi:hypothetical protein
VLVQLREIATSSNNNNTNMRWMSSNLYISHARKRASNKRGVSHTVITATYKVKEKNTLNNASARATLYSLSSS